MHTIANSVAFVFRASRTLPKPTRLLVPLRHDRCRIPGGRYREEHILRFFGDPYGKRCIRRECADGTNFLERSK